MVNVYDTLTMVKPQRLQKYIAGCGICSRRKAEILIEAGRVTINGKKASLGMSVNPDDKVMLDNKPILASDNPEQTFLVYKPRGYTSSVSDRFAEKLVTELVPSKLRLYPVGRLDKDSEGLIILTNNGDLANQLLHPRYELNKVYEVTLDRPLSAANRAGLLKGVFDQGENLEADNIIFKQSSSVIEITLHHGKKRHIRRMLARFDYQVLKLIRTQIGPLTLATLKGAPYLALTDQNIDHLLSSCLKPSS